MIDGLTVLGLITARGGSVGVRRKNLRTVGGKSLIVRAIEAGRGARTIDRLVLSSDDPEIVQAALLAGCEVPFVRPAELARSDTGSIAVVHHALDTLGEPYDLVVLLQPTSPFRTAEDIDGAVALCVERGAPACISLCEPDKSPFWMFELGGGGRMVPIADQSRYASRRQELPAVLAVNGAVYVAHSEWIRAHDNFLSPETVGYPMPRARSLDIDDELDLAIAEAVAEWLESSDDGAVPARQSL